MIGFEGVTEDVRQGFERVFGGQAEVVSRASGRAEIIGGHTDYNDGFVLAAAIDRCCFAAAGGRDDGKLCLYSQWAKQGDEFEFGPGVEISSEHKWANYGRGVAAILAQKGLRFSGANIYIYSEVPLGAGVSSSAALEVSIARVLTALAAEPFELEDMELAKVCQRAENEYAGSPCGIMDQAVSITGAADMAVLLDCRQLSTELVPLDHEKCVMMIFNSMVAHEVGGGEYGQRRAQCEDARDILGHKYAEVRALRDADMEMLDSVKDELDEVTYRRAKHVVGENARVLAAAEALKGGDMGRFGELISQSHASARDLYEISCEQTDFLADAVCGCEGAFGARIMGGGFGGSVVGVVKPAAAEVVARQVRDSYKRKFALDCEVHTVKAWQGTEIEGYIQ